MNQTISLQQRKLESLDFVVPGLNEYENLIVFIPELIDFLTTNKLTGTIIIVDDGSSDPTSTLYHQFQPTLPTGVRLELIEFSRNFGKEKAITAGLDTSSSQAAIIIDADRQHPLDMLPKMISKWEEGYDNVYTVINSRKKEGIIKRLATKAFYLILDDSSNPKIPSNAGDFRLLDKKLIQALNSMPERQRFMKGLYSWVGFTSYAFDYHPLPRTKGDSKFKFFALFKLAMDGITSFSLVPIRMATIAGAILSLFGFGFALWLTISYLLKIGIKDYNAIFALQIMLTGFILLTLGIIGEYIGNIYTEIKQRPIFIIKNHYGSKNNSEQTKNQPTNDL